MGRENKETLNYYIFFGKFRKSEEVLRKGDFYIFKDTPEDIIDFKRSYKEKEMIIIVNRSNYSKVITLNGENRSYKDRFSNEEFYSDVSITLDIEGESYKILTN